MKTCRKLKQIPHSRQKLNWVAGMLAVLCGACGCAKQGYFSSHPPHAAARLTGAIIPAADKARELAMWTGDGQPMAWGDLLQAAQWADVIIVGEQHDDTVGHAVELAVAQDVMSNWPRSAISLEMLERDEQPLLDDYFDGLIDDATLAKLTFSEKWAGEGSWTNWYQPLIDAAKNAPGGRGRAVAANAPRRYVRLARTDGYERLKSLPPARRKLFDLPRRALDDSYRQRFFDLMSDAEAHGDSSGASEADDPETKRRKVEAGFRSQSIWDATMAASIARAKRAGATKVVHFIGQFHSDFNGGTVQQLRRRLPHANILVISMQRDEVDRLREEDRGRADIIIYTGKPPPEEENDDPGPPAEQDTTPAVPVEPIAPAEPVVPASAVEPVPPSASSGF